ncbi:MAG TPA: Rieske (2Fe-2S) protein [Chloroflexota bacterium]|nr:Rieske (2Fe-2S) protein [Chloroflexota bacterium]
MPRYVVATVEEIPPGQRKIVEVSGISLGIFNVGGEFFALRNRCPHQGGPLCQGRLAGILQAREPGEYIYSRPGEILRCPWHGWEFDIRTGQSWFDPRRVRTRRYPVQIEPGAALLAAADAPPDPEAPAPGLQKGPYVAETYPVSLDRQYVVVELPAAG